MPKRTGGPGKGGRQSTPRGSRLLLSFISRATGRVASCLLMARPCRGYFATTVGSVSRQSLKATRWHRQAFTGLSPRSTAETTPPADFAGVSRRREAGAAQRPSPACAAGALCVAQDPRPVCRSASWVTAGTDEHAGSPGTGLQTVPSHFVRAPEVYSDKHDRASRKMVRKSTSVLPRVFT